MTTSDSHNTDETLARHASSIDYLAAGCWEWHGKTCNSTADNALAT